MKTEVRKNHPALERAIIGFWVVMDALEEFRSDGHECTEYCPCWEAPHMLYTLEIYSSSLEGSTIMFPAKIERNLAEARDRGDAEDVALYEKWLKVELAERAAAEAAEAAEAAPAENPFYAEA